MQHLVELDPVSGGLGKILGPHHEKIGPIIASQRTHQLLGRQNPQVDRRIPEAQPRFPSVLQDSGNVGRFEYAAIHQELTDALGSDR